VWGTSCDGSQIYCRSRFIPTCVGNISPSSLHGLPLSVHPHVCGEHTRIPGMEGVYHGSSPRVWGTSIRKLPNLVPLRFIPTCVGNIIHKKLKIFLFSVHPHVCGEHPAVSLLNDTHFGSSPRVWGTSF